MKIRRKLLSPLTWPVLSFALVIMLGTLALMWQGTNPQNPLSPVDALFMATSAVCVTGLSTVDVGSHFTHFGQWTMLVLIQAGGLGISTYTSLVFVLWRKKVPFTDRLAVSQALLNPSSFDIKAFLRGIILMVLGIEACAALALYLSDPVAFSPFSAVFHAVSAFCNAGFSLFATNMEAYQSNPAVNMVIMACIVLGGLGFAVLHESLGAFTALLRGKKTRLSHQARLVYTTSALLIFAGAGIIWLTEALRSDTGSAASLLWPALFQSVSARTAGFNSISIQSLTDASLLVLMVLMFIGGSPGSCAGGIKTTTFRVLSAFVHGQLTGARQIVLQGRAIASLAVSKALTLFFFASLVVVVSILVLTLTEGDHTGHTQAAVPLLELAFEVVSALGTVGLSMGITANLSDLGKLVIVANMFIGRVGLITMLLAVQSLRSDRHYAYPETYVPIG